MSDISPIYTPQAKTGTPAQGLAGSPSALSGGNGLFGNAGTGMSFFDLIFALTEGHANTAAGLKNPADKTSQPIKGQSVLETETTDIGTGSTPAIADPLLAETPVDAMPESPDAMPLMPVTPETPVPVSLPAVELDSAGQKKLLDALDNLLKGMPADQQHVVLKITPGQLKKAAAELNITLPKNGANADANLIATGLTPEQLTALVNRIATNKIAANKDVEIDADTQALLVGLVKIMPDGAKNEAIFLPRALILSKPAQTETLPETEIPEGSETGAELESSLTALIVPAPATPDAPVAVAIADTPAIAPNATQSAPANDSGFNDVLKMLEQIQGKGSDLKSIAPSPGSAAALAAAANGGGTEQTSANSAPPGPMNSTFTSFSNMFGSMMSGSGLNDTFPEGMDWSQNAAPGISNTQITGNAQLASLVTQAQHASQPHSATQIVAASLVKSAQGGENQTLKLKLDPPELGRIEVHMQFTKDKSMKAHMVIEKPETMLMLQRDAHVLERALQEAGMDSGGANLSFELSSGQNEFGNDRNGNNAGGSSPDATADDDGIEVIETTMTWYVDSDTGHQRYNILA